MIQTLSASVPFTVDPAWHPPFDDSALAPADFPCPLPVGTIYEAEDFGVVGDGRDSTVAMRNLIALVRAESPNQSLIHLPGGVIGSCRQPGDPPGLGVSRPIFRMDGISNICFIGDGQNVTTWKGFMDGMTDPATTWINTGNQGQGITRFTMFAGFSACSNIQWRSMTIDGGAGHTGDYTVGGSEKAVSATVAAGGTGHALNDVLTLTTTPVSGFPTEKATFQITGVSGGVVTSVTMLTAGRYTFLTASPISTTSSGPGTGCTLTITKTPTGDGWDTGHKAFQFDGPQTIDDLLIFNCRVKNFRGEQIFAGGTNVRKLSVVNTNVTGSNGSIISAASKLLIHTCVVGSPTVAGDKCYNGSENFCRVGTQGTRFVNSTIYAVKNAVAYLGFAACSASFENTNLISATGNCLLLSEIARNVSMTGGSMTGLNGLITSILGLYPGDPTGFADVTLDGIDLSHAGGSANVLQVAIPTNFKVRNCHLRAGTLLSGTNFAGTWTGFEFDNNTIDVGCRDVGGSYTGTVVALWSNTHHPAGETAPYPTIGNKYDFFSGDHGGFVFRTDWTNFNSNPLPAGSPFVMNVASIAGVPDGFTTSFKVGQSNFRLLANSAWNNFAANIPVTNGLTIRKNPTTHLFEVVA